MGDTETAVATSVRTSPLTADEIFEFHQKGFVRPGRVFDDAAVEALLEVQAHARERERAAGREYDLLDPALWPEEEKAPPEPGKSVGFMFNLWLEYPEYRQVSFHPVLARWAAQLIGARQVRILEDNALYKEPHSGGSLQWHQDYPYWPLAQPNAVTAWVALDKVTADNGAMRMAVGSHVAGETLPAAFGTGTPYLEERRVSTIKQAQDPTTLGMEVETIELEPGEVSFHHSLTLHASGPNVTDRPRRAAIVRFIGDGTVWLGARRYEFNYSDDEVGFAVGEPIQGRYFPIVPF